MLEHNQLDIIFEMQFDWGTMTLEDDPAIKLKDFLIFHLGCFARKDRLYTNKDELLTTASIDSLRSQWESDLDCLEKNSFEYHRMHQVHGNEVFKTTVKLLIAIVFSNRLSQTSIKNRTVIVRTGSPQFDVPLFLADYPEAIRRQVSAIVLKKQTNDDIQRIQHLNSNRNNLDAIETRSSDGVADDLDSVGNQSLDEDAVNQLHAKISPKRLRSGEVLSCDSDKRARDAK